MPILPPEPFLYPAELFASSTSDRPHEQQWWVMHTRPRTEKALARHCLAHHISFFLPLHRHYLRNRGRTLTSHVPLFSGYVFVLGDETARVEALTSNVIAHCLRVPDQGRLEADLVGVHRLMLSGMPVTLAEQLPPGTPVEIISGPLAGMSGKVVRKGKRVTFIVEVAFLQQGARVEIDASMLAKIV